MANEVTINIESSLAAMAFVVADQQEDIKQWRKEYDIQESKIAKLEDEIYGLTHKFDSQSELINGLTDDLAKARMERDIYNNELETVKVEFEKRNAEIENSNDIIRELTRYQTFDLFYKSKKGSYLCIVKNVGEYDYGTALGKLIHPGDIGVDIGIVSDCSSLCGCFGNTNLKILAFRNLLNTYDGDALEAYKEEE